MIEEMKEEMAENKITYLRKIDEQNEAISKLEFELSKAELDYKIKK